MPPPPPDFGGLTPAQFLAALERFGVKLDPNDLVATADAVFERMAAASRQGVVLAPGAGQALDKGIDGAFDRALELALKAIGGGVREEALARVEADEIWIAVADGNTCGDCMDRHAEVNAHAEWLRLGPPRSAALQCGRRCRCELLPYRGDVNAPDPYIQLAAYV